MVGYVGFMLNAIAVSSPQRAQEEWCIKLRKADFPGCTLSLPCCCRALRASASRRIHYRRRRSGAGGRCRRCLKASKANTDMVAMEHNKASSAEFQVAHCPHHVSVQDLTVVCRRLKPSEANTDMVAMEHNKALAEFQVAHCPHHVSVQDLAGHFAQRAWPP
jgi:hypothetical protein